LDQKRQHRNNHIADWQTSRLSQTEYCRQHELKFHQFIYWRRNFASKTAIPLSLVQVPAAAVARAKDFFSPSAALLVAVAPDVCIEVCPGFDPPTLQLVVLALRGIR
jgi:hypothetical protein